jgi:hypothetical protein
MTPLKTVRVATTTTVNDPRNVDELAGHVDISANKFQAQIQFLRQRFGLPPMRAKLVAELAFQQGKRA